MKYCYCDIPVPANWPVMNAYTWAKQNCPSYVTNDAIQKNGDYYYRFYFTDENDLTIFALKWG